jgi:hypothetical protein
MATNETNIDSKTRNRSRNILKQYYGNNDNSDQSVCDPFDIQSHDFNCEMFINKLLKECNLSQLMEREQTLYKEIQSLDSEMQTLVMKTIINSLALQKLLEK